ncbi:MAG: hypothetical protein ABEJ98_00435 [Candidatus Nanohaloarchaea archaeon]
MELLDRLPDLPYISNGVDEEFEENVYPAYQEFYRWSDVSARSGKKMDKAAEFMDAVVDYYDVEDVDEGVAAGRSFAPFVSDDLMDEEMSPEELKAFLDGEF